MDFDTIVRNGRVVLPDGGARAADVAIRGERIAAVLAPGVADAATAGATIDAAGKLVLPGLVDPHTHFGFGAGLADWETESRSAVVGGVTTVINYLISGAPYDDEFRQTLEAAGRASYVDYALHIVPSTPQQLADMPRYMREYGVWSYKFFTNFRGNEGKYLGVEGTDDGFLYRYLRTIGQHRGAVACVHAENIEVVWQLQKELQAAGRDDLAAWDESRPDWVEADYIHSTLLFASRVAAPTYVVHVTAELCLEEIRVARKRWPALPIYAETCPHYLTHTADMIMEPRALGKVNPPLRHRADVDALWEAVADGTIDTIGSDHVPRGKEKKGGAIWSASAGFPATGALLPVLLSEGLHKRGVPIERIVALTSYNPARIFGLYPRKGAIAPGSDADLVIVDPNLERVVEPSTFQSRADYSLYDDWTLKGWPILTMVRGQVVARDGHLAGAPGRAQYLPREATPI